MIPALYSQKNCIFLVLFLLLESFLKVLKLLFDLIGKKISDIYDFYNIFSIFWTISLSKQANTLREELKYI